MAREWISSSWFTGAAKNVCLSIRVVGMVAGTPHSRRKIIFVVCARDRGDGKIFIFDGRAGRKYGRILEYFPSICIIHILDVVRSRTPCGFTKQYRTLFRCNEDVHYFHNVYFTRNLPNISEINATATKRFNKIGDFIIQKFIPICSNQKILIY